MAITRKISGGLGTPVWILGERVRSAFPKVNFPGHQSLCLGSLLSHRHWEQAGAPTSQGRRHHRWRGNRGWFDNGNGCGLGDRNFLSLGHRPEGCQGQSRTNHDGGCARWEKSTSWSQRPHVLHHHPAGGGQVNPGSHQRLLPAHSRLALKARRAQEPNPGSRALRQPPV